MALRYNELLSGIDGLDLPCPDDEDHRRSWFVYVVALPEGTDREARDRHARARGVQTARYLPCIHLQSYMRERYGFREGLCPVAEGISSRTLALPFHARLEPRRPGDRRGGAPRSAARVRREPGQGEALARLGPLGARRARGPRHVLALDPAQLYHTSGEGLRGGLGRVAVLLSFPISLVAVALALLALAALSRNAWWVGGPAIALCAVTAVPGVVASGRPRRTLGQRPAGRSASRSRLGLTAAAALRAGISLAPRLPADPLRIALGVVVGVLSLPWLSAELGFHLPGDVFLGEEVPAGETARPPSISGTTTASTAPCSSRSALLLSRRRPPRPVCRGLHRIRLARASATAQ